MRFTLTLFPLEPGTPLGESAAALRAQIDGAGLRYTLTRSGATVEAAWDEMAPLLGRADTALRTRHDRVALVAAVEDAP